MFAVTDCMCIRLRTALGRAIVEQERSSMMNGGAGIEQDEEARKAAGMKVIDLFAGVFAR